MNMDTETFWKLLEPVHPMAAAFCHKLAGDRDEGHDLYQDSLLTAMRRFGSLRDHAAFRPWLFQILVNRYKNRCRSFWWKRRVPLTPDMIDTLRGGDPHEEYDLRRLLHRLLGMLAPEDKALLVLHELEGWPIAELAMMFKKPEGTIKNRLFRAKRTIRDRVTRMLPEPKTDLSTGEALYALRRSEIPND